MLIEKMSMSSGSQMSQGTEPTERDITELKHITVLYKESDQ